MTELVHTRQALNPMELQQARELATMVAKIQLCGSKTWEDACTRILTGKDLGLSPMQSMRVVYVVEGRTCLDASFMHALCLQSPACEKFECVEESDTSVTYAVKRKNQSEQRVTWTIEDAKRAGLANKGNWAKYPRQMLHARCKADAARRVFSDCLLGLKSIEELRDGIEDAPVTAVHIVDASTEVVPPVSEVLLHRIEQALPTDKDALVEPIKKAIEGGEVDKEAVKKIKDAYAVKFGIKKTNSKVQDPAVESPTEPETVTVEQDIDRGEDPDAY